MGDRESPRKFFEQNEEKRGGGRKNSSKLAKIPVEMNIEIYAPCFTVLFRFLRE